MLREQVYDYGETILASFHSSDSIMIIWQGLVQVRVNRIDHETGETEDLWFDTLEKGACLSVYNAFNPDWTSLINFKASEKNTILLKLKASDLEDLGVKNYQIKYKVEIAKLRIKNNAVDEIDYFTFPKKYLEVNLVNQTRKDMAIKRQNQCEKKAIMIK